MEYTFLTEKFYNDYPHDKYPQIEIKVDRPYAHVHVSAYIRLTYTIDLAKAIIQDIDENNAKHVAKIILGFAE